ncbi:MAG: hypothetical protein HQL34_00795 [Alphaproteobacteria bacterium]|nr:hypothetical protein [Alphaproteobacteria bacterium]
MDWNITHHPAPTMASLAPLLHGAVRILAGLARSSIIATAGLGVIYAGLVLGITACSLLLQ